MTGTLRATHWPTCCLYAADRSHGATEHAPAFTVPSPGS
jgi:hypothetical protein